MKALQDRIRKEGKILPGGIVKVDGFLNHCIDAAFLGELSDEFAQRFDMSRVTKILTAEASGIPLAAICAYKTGIPMVFAKKAKSDNIEGGLFQSATYAYSCQSGSTLLCAKEWIHPDDKVLILDDFLANCIDIRGLISIVEQAGAELVGIGAAVEKGFQHGGDNLRAEGYRVESLVIIDQADEHGFVFRQDC